MRSAPRALMTTVGSAEGFGKLPAELAAEFLAEYCPGFRANVSALSLTARDSLQS
jgi:hypothetical protein